MFRRRQVPAVLQMNSVECGAACLAMILGYHGRHASLAECRDACTPGRDGVTAQTIVTAARNLGMRVKAYSVQADADLRDLTLPAIVHWNFGHFLVLSGISQRGVEVVDPAEGRRHLTAEEFAQGFTGIILVMEPGPQFEPRPATTEPLWRQFLRAMWRTSGTPAALGQILIASLILQVLGLGVPLFTQVMVDTVLPYGIRNVLVILGLGMAILVVAQMVSGYLRSTVMIYLQTRLDTQLMFGFFERLLTLPFRFFQQRSTGDLIMRLASNSQIRSILTSQALSVFLDGGLVLAYLAILLWRDAPLGFLSLAIGVVQTGLLLATLRHTAALTQQRLAAEAESQGYLIEALTGIATLKATGAEDRALDRWSNLFIKELNIASRLSHLEAVIETALLGVRTAAPLLLLWVGAWRVLEGSLTLGTMLGLSALALAFLSPLTALMANWQRLQLVGAFLERIADVLHAEPEQDLHTVHPAPVLSGRIEVRNVSFRYDAQAPYVLRNVSLVIESGQKVALVGRSGCGKSTLAKLLLGLHSPSEGEIWYHAVGGDLSQGIPLPTLNYPSLRRQFGVVLQESFLFSGSIRRNIAFQNPDLDMTAIDEAARLAAMDQEIAEMPMGYQTLVAEGGTGLSGGQRQRLSIARALANKPTIFILDEATSHLDVVTERTVDENLNRLAATRIVIAHRLSTVKNADQILVMDQGMIVERGTHDELMGHRGVYFDLVGSG